MRLKSQPWSSQWEVPEYIGLESQVRLVKEVVPKQVGLEAQVSLVKEMMPK